MSVEGDVRRDEEKPKPIGAAAKVDPTLLKPGQLVERWTETTTAGVWIPLPCHESQAVKVERDHTVGMTVVVCRICSRTYEMYLEPDFEGGFFALLTVAYVPHLISRKRAA